MLKTTAILQIALASLAFACIGEFETCPSTGECVLDSSLCGSCKAGEYLCPNTPKATTKTCVENAEAYVKCPGLQGTHLDWTLDIESRLTYLAANTNITEQIWQLQNGMPSLLHLGIPEEQLLCDDEHGVKSNATTFFPDGSGTGPSWSKQLVREMGQVIASEARALHALMTSMGVRGINPRINGIGITGYSPNLNLAVNPRWGRNQEVFGEDPKHMALLVQEMIQGMQKYNGSNDDYLAMVAGPKHFAVYNVETIPTQRHNFSANVNVRNFVESYLVGFKYAVVDAKGMNIMCSYNEVNGVPTCGDKNLLTGILKEHWNFTGWVVSDYDALADEVNSHFYCPDFACAAALSFNAGCDQEGGGTDVISAIPQAISAGTLDADKVATALKNIYRSRIELGFHDPPTMVSYNYMPPSELRSAAHLETARKIASSAAVLLKNDKSTLPLNRAKIQKAALIGPQMVMESLLLGNYAVMPSIGVPTLLQGFVDGLDSFSNFSAKCEYLNNTDFLQPGQAASTDSPTPENCGDLCAYTPGCVAFTFYQGECFLKNSTQGRTSSSGRTSGTCSNRPPAFSKVSYAPGCLDIGCETTDGFQAAVDAAKGADTIIVSLGLYFEGDDWWVEREAHDRTSMNMPGQQAALLHTLRTTYPNTPIVVLLIHGGPIVLGSVLDDADAILDAHYPGLMGAYGVADVLFGDVAAAGRTTTTWYSSDADLPTPGTVNLYPQEEPSGKGLTYRYYNGSIQFPFGYGLSYTSFSFSNLKLNATSIHPCDSIQVSVDVTNTGNVDSDEVVQLYLKTPHASVPAPNVRLVDFDRVHIPAQKTVTVSSLIISPMDHSVVYNGDSTDIYNPTQMIEQGEVVVFVGDGQPDHSKNYKSTTFSVQAASRLQVCDPAWW